MTNATNFITDLFLRLTSKTYPHGSEQIIVDEMMSLGIFPSDLKKDNHGNYFYKIGNSSRTIFASHLDTVSSKHEPVTHVLDGDMIKTDGTTTLGADDKAGVSVMVWLMKNKVPGTYYFFIGEEVGCIGSGLASKNDDFSEYDRIISFDRRNTGSIITHQSWSRCCSDDFADDLCKQLNEAGFELNYEKDDGGVYTDSAEFVEYIPECTNVSVGYYSEHTFSERQDIKHLIALCEACVVVDWESLPTKRDPSVYEPKSYKTTYSKTYKSYKTYDDFEDTDIDMYPNTNWSKDYTNKTNSKVGKAWSRTGTVHSHREEFEEQEEFYSSNGTSIDYYESDKDTWEPKKVRRSKKVSKTFFDDGGSLVEIKTDRTDKTQYDWIKYKLSKNADEKLTEKELIIIREQYLDIDNNDYDKFYYEHLVDEMEIE